MALVTFKFVSVSTMPMGLANIMLVFLPYD